MKNWTFEPADEGIAAELQSFLPASVFDIHAHLYRRTDLPGSVTGVIAEGPDEVSAAVWRERVGRQVGAARLGGGLLFPVPFVPAGEMVRANDYLLRQLDRDASLRGLALVAPATTVEQARAWAGHPSCAGFKPYHLYSANRPTFQARLADYLPDWAWELAHERGLLLMLHLVRDAALADPDNQGDLRERCERFPNARVVLAHAGRGFHAPNTVRGVAALRGLSNLWFDTSAVCEPAALGAILDEFGPRRLMWGSDFPVSELRGKCVTVGDGFAWLQPDTVRWERLSPACRPTLVGLESLRALRAAAGHFGLSEADRQDIFAGNAMRLLGLEPGRATLTQDLYRRAKERIPGGTQLLSKRPEMMAPDQWPAYFREARGCETWDLDGRHYYDLSTNGIGACLLGFRHPDVTRAVQRRVALGSMCTLNAPEEVDLADRLCALHPWADQVRYARCGGEACAVAVRIARATTDRSVVAICGYSGWQDWYLAANLGAEDALRGHLLPGLAPLGVPRELRGTARTFTFNRRDEFQAILDQHGERLAAVIMEPCRSADPDPGFLEFVREGAHRHGALLIFDEITIGWRLNRGGAHLKFGVAPDLAVFAKALGNGHPMAAVLGTRAAMAGAHGSFVSSTYWTESVGPAAALAALRVMETHDVPAHIARIGERIQSTWRDHAARHELPVRIGGYPCLAHFRFEHPQAEALRTLFTQMMLARGFLAGTGVYTTLAHTDPVVDRYAEAVDAVFGELAGAIATGDVARRLRGPVAHTGFRRLTG